MSAAPAAGEPASAQPPPPPARAWSKPPACSTQLLTSCLRVSTTDAVMFCHDRAGPNHVGPLLSVFAVITDNGAGIHPKTTAVHQEVGPQGREQAPETASPRTENHRFRPAPGSQARIRRDRGLRTSRRAVLVCRCPQFLHLGGDSAARMPSSLHPAPCPHFPASPPLPFVSPRLLC